MEIKVKKLHPDAVLPTKGSPGAACWDISVVEDYSLSRDVIQEVRTKLAFEVPNGYELVIRPRSGLSKKGLVICNSPATLDSDYRGELILLVRNTQSRLSGTGMWIHLHKGDRVAQIKVNPVLSTEFIEVSELSETERGEKGFGSTGR